MGETFKIFLTAGLTILGGVFVYVIGQIISKFMIEPIHEQKKIISEINDNLIFYANQFYLYTEVNPKAEEIRNKFRSFSAQLRAKTHLIPFYVLFQKLRMVLRKEDIYGACSSLVGLSNSVYKIEGQDISHVESYRNEISTKLKIKL